MTYIMDNTSKDKEIMVNHHKYNHQLWNVDCGVMFFNDSYHLNSSKDTIFKIEALSRYGVFCVRITFLLIHS